MFEMHFGTVPFWCEANCAASIISAKEFKLEEVFQILTALRASLEKTCILVAKDSAVNLGDCISMQVVLLDSSLQLPSSVLVRPSPSDALLLGT